MFKKKYYLKIYDDINGIDLVWPRSIKHLMELHQDFCFENKERLKKYYEDYFDLEIKEYKNNVYLLFKTERQKKLFLIKFS